jgi:hypothetical protein
LIKIEDYNGSIFTLLKNVAYDGGYWAKKKDIQEALKWGGSFHIYHINPYTHVRTNIQSFVRICPVKGPLKIELGCHVFSGRARRTLITWLKESK